MLQWAHLPTSPKKAAPDLFSQLNGTETVPLCHQPYQTNSARSNAITYLYTQAHVGAYSKGYNAALLLPSAATRCVSCNACVPSFEDGGHMRGST
jgi:hypothetical protein